MKTAVFWDVTPCGYVPPKRRFAQEPKGVTYQKTAVFIVTAVKTSNLTLFSSAGKLIYDTYVSRRCGTRGPSYCVPFLDIVYLRSVRRLLVIANVVSSSPILVTLMMDALRSSET
jgi:hypothetical protein